MFLQSRGELAFVCNILDNNMFNMPLESKIFSMFLREFLPCPLSPSQISQDSVLGVPGSRLSEHPRLYGLSLGRSSGAMKQIQSELANAQAEHEYS